jgi:hypothetical protein
MPHATGTQPQKPDNYRASRTASLTPCLTCLTCLDTEDAFRAGNTPDPGEITATTALLLAGTAEWVVSRRLGHAHVQTTLDIYGWVREDEALRAAANWKSFASTWQVHDER